MKSILTLLLCLSSSLAYSQAAPPIDSDTKLITYSEVIQAPGASQAELYTRAKLWFVSAFKSSKDAMQVDEKEAGIVQGTGWRTIRLPAGEDSLSLRLWYTVKIAVKQGRYKYDVSSFQTQFFPDSDEPSPTKYSVESVINNSKATPEARENQVKQVATTAKDVAVTIKKAMSKPAAGSEF